MNKKNMAKSCRVSATAFDKWGVTPVERKGREAFYDVASVIENRVNNAISQLIKTKARLTMMNFYESGSDYWQHRQRRRNLKTIAIAVTWLILSFACTRFQSWRVRFHQSWTASRLLCKGASHRLPPPCWTGLKGKWLKPVMPVPELPTTSHRYWLITWKKQPETYRKSCYRRKASNRRAIIEQKWERIW